MLTPRSLALREAPPFALARVDLASRAHGSRVRQPLSDVTNRRGIDPYHHSLNQRHRFELRYFITEGHLDRWVYSTPGSSKRM